MDREFMCSIKVENVSPAAVFLQNIILQPVDGLTASPLSADRSDEPASPTYRAAHGKVGHYFCAGDAISWLFSLTPSSDVVDKGYLKQIPLLGSLTLEWMNLQGGRGSTPDWPIPLQVLPVRAVDLRVTDAPHLVGVEQSFWITIDVLNQSDQSIEPLLILRPEKMGAIQAHGALTHPVEPLSPGMLASLRLPFVTAMPGLHNLDGLAVLDRVTNQEYDFPGVCSIVVS
jgi:hypothetical protein